jgi:hypothetical protein
MVNVELMGQGGQQPWAGTSGMPRRECQNLQQIPVPVTAMLKKIVRMISQWLRSISLSYGTLLY